MSSAKVCMRGRLVPMKFPPTAEGVHTLTVLSGR